MYRFLRSEAHVVAVENDEGTMDEAARGHVEAPPDLRNRLRVGQPRVKEARCVHHVQNIPWAPKTNNDVIPLK